MNIIIKIREVIRDSSKLSNLRNFVINRRLYE